MHFRKEKGHKFKGMCLKRAERGLTLFFAAVLVLGGCTEEDQQGEVRNKVVVAIAEEGPEKEATGEEPQAGAALPQESASKNDPSGASEPEKPTAVADKEVKPSAAKQGMAPPGETAGGVASRAKPEPVETVGKSDSGIEKGFAMVRPGESLRAFSAREDTCGDALKWPKLYFLNLQRLSKLRTWKEIDDEPLPQGLALRYLEPVGGKGLQSPPKSNPWVVTVRSWPTPERLAVPAIKLIKGGFRVYITKAKVKGKRWLRLRVGFYPNQSEALAARRKIREIVESNDSWIARAGKGELEEFGR